jgi:hypothetical protein
MDRKDSTDCKVSAKIGATNAQVQRSDDENAHCLVLAIECQSVRPLLGCLIVLASRPELRAPGGQGCDERVQTHA